MFALLFQQGKFNFHISLDLENLFDILIIVACEYVQVLVQVSEEKLPL